MMSKSINCGWSICCSEKKKNGEEICCSEYWCLCCMFRLQPKNIVGGVDVEGLSPRDDDGMINATFTFPADPCRQTTTARRKIEEQQSSRWVE